MYNSVFYLFSTIFFVDRNHPFLTRHSEGVALSVAEGYLDAAVVVRKSITRIIFSGWCDLTFSTFTFYGCFLKPHENSVDPVLNHVS